MSKSSVVIAAIGGVFIGGCGVGVLFNSANHAPGFAIAVGIAGIVAGSFLVAKAYLDTN